MVKAADALAFVNDNERIRGAVDAAVDAAPDLSADQVAFLRATGFPFVAPLAAAA